MSMCAWGVRTDQGTPGLNYFYGVLGCVTPVPVSTFRTTRIAGRPLGQWVPTPKSWSTN